MMYCDNKRFTISPLHVQRVYTHALIYIIIVLQQCYYYIMYIIFILQSIKYILRII